jgi:pantoate--beta-alanine ligase
MISSALNKASNLIKQNQLSVNIIINTINDYLKQSDIINIEYIYIINRDFDMIKDVELNNSIILIAVKIGNTRLIDNIWI